MDYCAPCAFSGRFSLQFEKGKENQEHAIFFEKFTFFSILISEFQFSSPTLDIPFPIWESSPYSNSPKPQAVEEAMEKTQRPHIS
jgi:hypothetical protein